jgi:GT2 family glycosyltransferase
MANVTPNLVVWPPVTIIVLNWNAARFLPGCLPALLALDYPDYRVLVVDNASTDNSVALVREQFPQVELIRNRHNHGFAAGNNSGLRQVQTEFAVLVNPDVIVPADWLKQLLRPLLVDETIGVAGCKLTYPDGTLQHAGGSIEGAQAFPSHAGYQEQDTGQHDQMQDVIYVVGAAMALRMTMLERIGALDEGYFLYYEDVDLCVRARRSGYRVVYVPEATAIHVESSATDRRSDFYWEQMFTSRWRYLSKHMESATLFNETIAAEEQWLQLLAPQQRAAAAHAYHETLRQLPEITEARARDGMLPFSTSEVEQLRSALRSLRLAAWQPTESALTQLASKAVIEEVPFRSAVPLAGRLVAWLRERWLNVATRWYVRPLLAQQNRFNQEFAGRLLEQAARLHVQHKAQADQLVELAEVAARLAEMERSLRRLEARQAKAASSPRESDSR